MSYGALKALDSISAQVYIFLMPRPRRTPNAGEPAMVRTTLVMPEALWRQAKIRALQENRDLRDLLIEGLELILKRGKGGK